METPCISIVIVSWNTREYLINCLKSIEQTARGLCYEVIVVDNASSDGSAEAVREAEFPNVRLIETGANLGFAKGNNVGIRQSSGRYYCLINSDVVVKPECLQRLLAFMESHPEVGLAGPRLFNGDGSFQDSCRIEPTLGTRFARAINMPVIDSAYKGRQTKEVAVLAASFWIARRKAVDEIGLLDEAFFFYGEDHDWCQRLRAGGWKIYYLPEAEAIHFGGASSALDPFRFNTELQKAVLQLWEKYHGQVSTLTFLAIGMLYHGLRLGVRGLRLIWPGGSRAPVLDKLRQHRDALRWLAQAFMERVVWRGWPTVEGDGKAADTKPTG